MRMLLFILCVAEILMVTYLMNFAGPFVSPVIFFGISISIAFVFLKITGNQPTERQVVAVSKAVTSGIKILQIFIFTLLSAIIFTSLRKLWAPYPLSKDDLRFSDIIPQIMYLVKRFNAGKQPYAPIQFGKNSLFPTYLPLQWLPYLFAEWLNKDYRWVPAIALWLSSLYFFIKSFSVANVINQIPLKIVASVWPLVVWLTWIKYDGMAFVITVESLVAGYYLFVSANIRDKNVFPLAVGISLCLLSRYSLVIWVPMCLICYYISGKRKQSYLLLSTIILFFIIFYWIPFLRVDPHIFSKGYQYHNVAALYDWGFQHYLFNGLGFASFGYTYLSGSVANKLHTYQFIHLSLCILTVTVCALFYKKNIHRYSLKTMLLFSFKIYITIFYAFIQTPYNYIFMVPLMISSALLMNVYPLRGNFDKTTLITELD